jgi:uncharacterized repeat protein (TIGR03803 family)
LCVAAATTVPAQKLTTLYTFCSQANCADGAYPVGSLVLGKDGNFYGITGFGGSGYNKIASNFGGGTFFQLSPNGLATLYDFCDTNNCDMSPNGSPVQGSDGNFYGTTGVGGTSNNGTVFKITPGGMFTILYSFCLGGGVCADGQAPRSRLIHGSDGNFYGTTSAGGTFRAGTVFKITPKGTLTTLYSFCTQPLLDCPDGQDPLGGLVQGSDGNFYGTTSGGGRGGGTIFKMAPNGNLTTLYSFCGLVTCPDGDTPAGSLIQGTDGDFYGMTAFGGVNGNGAVFKVASDGSLTTLHSFCSQPLCTDGSLPFDGIGPPGKDWALYQGPDGNFYGTTAYGGANNSGTVFKITPSGKLTTLYSFCPQVGPPNFCPDGAVPLGGVIRGPGGNLYGFTNTGGTTNAGTVYKLTPACTPDSDVTSSLAITRSGLSYDIHSKQYGQTLMVKNTSGNSITGTIYLVLDNLSPADATLSNAIGKTSCSPPAGSPYVSITGPLNAAASVQVALHFTDPTNGRITYFTRVLGGAGQP